MPLHKVSKYKKIRLCSWHTPPHADHIGGLDDVINTFDIGYIYMPRKTATTMTYKDANNCSIVLKLQYKENSFLFTGDVERKSENAMINSNLDLKCDVLKIPHHGSRTSSSKSFIKAVNPKVETMKRFKKDEIPVYRTDESGTIIVIGDGTSLEFNKNAGSYGGIIIK